MEAEALQASAETLFPSLANDAKVPDALWPSDNALGIPVLDPLMQANALDLPVSTWGAMGRTKLTRHAATVLFYTEDYRFEGLWAKPRTVLNGRVVNAGEPNFSVGPQTPVAQAVWNTYRKRWLARYWQECGLRIFVDLFVDETFGALNLVGVPAGWRAYCDRGHTDSVDQLDHDLAVAHAHAGCRPLFVVYGGGKTVLAWARYHAEDGVLWVPESTDVAQGRAIATEGQLLLEGLVNRGATE